MGSKYLVAKKIKIKVRLVRHPELININSSYTFGNHLTFKLDLDDQFFKYFITPLPPPPLPQQTLGSSM
jgi:hypothetical protein